MSSYNGKIPHLLRSAPGWLALRKKILSEEPNCRACSQLGYERAATEIDHIIPRAKGGGHGIENLQPLCRECHGYKSGREKNNNRDERIPYYVNGSRHAMTAPTPPRDLGASPRSRFLNRSHYVKG